MLGAYVDETRDRTYLERMKKLVSLAAVVAACLVFAPSAGAITFGQLDGNTHPNVGGLFADWDPMVPGPDFLCTGTLISPTVFLTASHCTAFLTSVGVDPDEVFVSFDSDVANDDGSFRTGAQQLPGTYHTHPRFGPHFGDGDPHDIAAVVLDSPYNGASPASLPTLDQFAGKKSLIGSQYTAVGYGDVREIKQTGANALFFDGQRRFVAQSLTGLTKIWFKMTMNPLKGSGGTCFGDSGGPHFLGTGAGTYPGTVVALTVGGDGACRSTDVDYRLDTASARAFLDDFVNLP
jgi:trypsin